MRIRKRWIGLGVGVGVVAIVVYGAVDLMSARPAPRFNATARMDELVRSVQPPGENSWPAHRALLDEASERGVGDRGWPHDSATPRDDRQSPWVGAWDDPRHDAWRDALTSGRDLVEDLVAAASLPGYRRVILPAADMTDDPLDAPPEAWPSGPLWITPDPGYARMRQLSRLLVAGMREAAANDDWDEAARLTTAGVRVGRQNTYQGLTIEWLIGLSRINIALQELRSLLQEREAPPAFCRQVLEALGDPARVMAPRTHVVEVERLLALDVAQWSFDDDGRLVVWALDRGLRNLQAPTTATERAANLTSFLHPGYESTVEAMNGYFDAMAALAQGGPADVAAAERRLDENRIASVVVPPQDPVVGNSLYLIQQAAGTRVMLYLEIYHAEHGRWPDALAEAMPVEETICPGGDEPFEYIVREDGYELFIPRSAPAPDEDGWESDEERRLMAEREPFPEEEW